MPIRRGVAGWRRRREAERDMPSHIYRHTPSSISLPARNRKNRRPCMSACFQLLAPFAAHCINRTSRRPFKHRHHFLRGLYRANSVSGRCRFTEMAMAYWIDDTIDADGFFRTLERASPVGDRPQIFIDRCGQRRHERAYRRCHKPSVEIADTMLPMSELGFCRRSLSSCP